MDTSTPAPMVNAELLRRYAGRKVRCVLKVLRAEAGGSVVVGQTADNQQVSARLHAGSAPPSLSEFVEVTGVVDGDRSIRAESWTHFGSNFDMSSYNQLCQLANGECQQLFI